MGTYDISYKRTVYDLQRLTLTKKAPPLLTGRFLEKHYILQLVCYLAFLSLPSLGLRRVMSSGFLTIYLYVSHGSPRHIILVLCATLAIVIPADLLRFRFPRFAQVYERHLGFLMRESEKVCHLQP
jgi:hypothetical protein